MMVDYSFRKKKKEVGPPFIHLLIHLFALLQVKRLWATG